MLALADAVGSGKIPQTEIGVVISDHANAAGLAAAQNLGLATIVVERKGRAREKHDADVVAALKEHAVDLVCLAGYMRVLSSSFLEAFRGAILNIHPSLLPAFPGLNAQLQAIEHGVKFTGCTVHFVDETLDGGPIIVQKIVPVLDDDTEQTLSERILAEEHKLYPAAVALVASGKYEVVGRRVLLKS